MNKKNLSSTKLPTTLLKRFKEKYLIKNTFLQLYHIFKERKKENVKQ